MKTIRIGHSPDPDDAFMFYGFASGEARVAGHRIVHVLQDIQSLNELAHTADPLEVTALSLHAFFELADKYELLEVGTSVGRGYGPRLIAMKPAPLASLAGRRIAMPGPKTTATLVARKLLPEFDEVHMDFTKIMDAVRNGDCDAGVIIHEGQLTYAEEGFALLADFGEMFAGRHAGLPLPLGVNCIRRDLDASLKREVADAYRESVRIAMTQRAAAVDYAMRYARGLAHDKADRFVSMYVNEDSLDFNPEIREAVEILEKEYWNHAPATC